MHAFVEQQLSNPDFVSWVNLLRGVEPGRFTSFEAPTSVKDAATASGIDWEKFINETLPMILAIIAMFGK